MKWPLVTRAKYNRQVSWARLWETTAKNEQRQNRELRDLLQAAERKLARFERPRDTDGKFTEQKTAAKPAQTGAP